ncbi:hypothetical protein [Streptomyces sp. NK08204]|uniref:hypothetical protein n=1 Tax=Streptomyces sp. NK08204 TaxID=2873260 RepID=UPI001CEC5804|nr:hypothetical protein [Streptomyces sp. NK08204]
MPGSDHNTVAIDPVTNRTAHRYRISGTTWKYSLYDLATFKAGTFTPLATITQPSVLTGPTFQGYTSMGQYLYTIDGTAYTYDSDGNRTSTSNTPTVARLHLGFGSEESLTQTDKKASFYYKDLVV